MNANSQPARPAIKTWLNRAAKKLSDADIESACLDAELLLAHSLRKNRIYLHAHPEARLANKTILKADELLDNRLKRIPLAYIVGQKEFYNRDFLVTPDVLIPRPESEDIINLLKTLDLSGNLIDVGTGSGCLGITAKLEFPNLDVSLIDISEPALKIARKNARTLNARVNVIKNDLLDGLRLTPRIIIANLPYVNPKWSRSPETDFEPKIALFASDGGLEQINKLIIQSATILSDNGYLILEADPTQHERIIKLAINYNLDEFKIEGYCLALIKRIDAHAVKANQ